MESLFDVCFAGQLLPGQELQDVRQKVQKLFNANPETLDKLFSGKTQLVKRSCDQVTAAKYKQAMARAGAKAIVRACEPNTEQAPQAATKPQADSEQDSAINLAPTGADILRPEERTAEVVSEVDISDIELTDAGTDLSDHQPSNATAPDTSHLSVGEVGEDIPNLADSRTPLDPDIDDISLSPQGTDFSDCAEPEHEAPAIDLSKLEISPAGSDVLEEKYKKSAEEKAPDTAHISLED